MVPKLTEHPGLLKEMGNFRPEDSHIEFPNWIPIWHVESLFLQNTQRVGKQLQYV